MAGRDVRYIEADGARRRVYTLAHAARVLEMSQRTLLRQLQRDTFRGADVWAPRVSPNTTTMWLLAGDDIDAMARIDASGDGRPALALVDVEQLERENAALRARVETLELEEALRYRERITELEEQNTNLRHQNAVLTAEMQRAMSMVSNVLGAYAPQPAAHAS